MVVRCFRTDAQIIALFKRKNPKDLDEITSLGLAPKYFHKGCDRKVYRLGQNMVLKLEDESHSSYNQTPHEIKLIRRIRRFKKYKTIRKHVMKMYYGNIENRVMLTQFVMRRIDYTAEDRKRVEEMDDKIRKLLPGCIDLHSGNFRISDKNVLICIDLGYDSKNVSERS